MYLYSISAFYFSGCFPAVLVYVQSASATAMFSLMASCFCIHAGVTLSWLHSWHLADSACTSSKGYASSGCYPKQKHVVSQVNGADSLIPLLPNRSASHLFRQD